MSAETERQRLRRQRDRLRTERDTWKAWAAGLFGLAVLEAFVIGSALLAIARLAVTP